MRLIYISPLRYPSEKAGSAFSMKSCETFADLGMEVELWVPWRVNPLDDQNPFIYHGVRQNFRIVRLPALDLRLISNHFFLLLSISFAISVFFYTIFRNVTDALYYSHEEFALYLLTFIRKKTVYEIHDFPSAHLLYKSLLSHVKYIVTTNHWKENELRNRFGVPQAKILVVPNAVDIAQFSISLSKEEARRKLNIPLDRLLVVYAGHLYGWKGVSTLYEAAKLLREQVKVYFVGGTNIDVSKFQLQKEKDNLSNVEFIGHRPHVEIPVWLKAADVLVLPNTAKVDISKYYTSPMKLFEYMASGTPIIASDLPSIREVVDEMLVYFFKPDSATDLKRAIEDVLSNPSDAAKKSARAYTTVQRYTWDVRAKEIINEIDFVK